MFTVLRCVFRLLLAAVVFYSLSAGHRADAQYAFTRITATTVSNTGFTPPSINRNGTVAFFQANGSDSSAIYLGDGGPLTTIATENAAVNLSSLGQPTINSAGKVAFIERHNGGPAKLFVSDGSTTTLLYDNAGTFNIVALPSINASGTVAFNGGIRFGPQGIFRGDGLSTTTITDTSSGMFTGFLGVPSLNTGGTVAFWGVLSGGGQGIYRGNGGALTTIADTTSGVFMGNFSQPSLNDEGTVAFRGVTASDVGIYKGDGGALATVALGGAGHAYTSLPGQGPAINNHGEVAFNATTASGSGIFTGSDPVADKVIARGDTLFGATVLDVNMWSYGLNDSGQIAFVAHLSDGSIGIYRASPVPAPGALLTALLGVLPGAGLLLRRRMRNVEPKTTY